jgi:RNA polymerase sigma-70 factor (ECF subfamily)
MTTKRPDPENDLFPQMYRELHRVAGGYLRRERKNHTLQPTALVNEAWIRVQKEQGHELKGRTHGLAIAAQAMRRLLIDHGRHQKRDKRGGGAQPVELNDLMNAAAEGPVPVEDLLEAIDPRAAQIVTLRFFSGMSSREVAEHLQLSLRTVEGDWAHARAWLKRELSGEQHPSPDE